LIPTQPIHELTRERERQEKHWPENAVEMSAMHGAYLNDQQLAWESDRSQKIRPLEGGVSLHQGVEVCMHHP
jgi:hypothetical protein